MGTARPDSSTGAQSCPRDSGPDSRGFLVLGAGNPGPGHFCPFSNSDSSFQSGQFNEDMIPTVGFNMRKITKGNVTIKVGTRAAEGVEGWEDRVFGGGC